jgi:hypothetical protein
MVCLTHLNLETSRLNRSTDMTPFRKLWNTFVDAIKPQMLRDRDAGLHAIVVDTRPFNMSGKGR